MALQSGKYPGFFLGAERVLLAGNLKGNGTTDPVAADYEGIPGASWARNGVGNYTLTLPGRGTVNVMAVMAVVESASPVDVRVESRDDDARTITFQTETPEAGATPVADVDLTTSDFLHVQIVVKNSDLLNA